MKIIDGLSLARQKFFSTISLRSKKVIVNAFNSLFVKVFSIIANFTLIAISIDCVNAENYGLWITISSVITWITIFDLGLVTSLRNKITQALAYQDWVTAQKYTSTTYAMLSIVVIPLWLIFVVINPSINWQSLFNTSVSKEVLEPLIFWVFTSFCLQFLMKPISSILAGDQKHFIDAFIVLVSNVVCIALILLFKPHFINSIYLLSLLLGLTPCIILAVATMILFEFKYKSLRPSIGGIDFTYRKQLLGVGIKFFIIQMGGLVIFSSNNIIISQLIGNEEVTTFYIVFRYFSILTIFYSLINAPIWTAYTEAYTLDDWQWIRRVTRNANQLCSLLLILTVVMLLLSPWVYKIWVNDSVAIPFSLSLLMAINVAINLFGTTYTSFINGTGKLRLQMFYSLFASLLHIPLGYLLTSSLRFGLNGLVLLNIFWSVGSLLLWKIQYSKILNKSPRYIWN